MFEVCVGTKVGVAYWWFVPVTAIEVTLTRYWPISIAGHASSLSHKHVAGMVHVSLMSLFSCIMGFIYSTSTTTLKCMLRRHCEYMWWEIWFVFTFSNVKNAESCSAPGPAWWVLSMSTLADKVKYHCQSTACSGHFCHYFLVLWASPIWYMSTTTLKYLLWAHSEGICCEL